MRARASTNRARSGTAALGATAALLLGAGAAAADPAATMRASFAPDQLGALGAVTVALTLTDLEAQGLVPPPLRTLTVHLPPEVGLKMHGVPVCRPAALRRRGAAGCFKRSIVGGGRATLEVHAGSQTIPEASRLTAFRGPTIGGLPTLEILGVGRTPLEQRSVSHAVLEPDTAPLQLSQQLVISIPRIPTVALEPDASFLSMSLTIGAEGGLGSQRAGIRVPRKCARGGFAFAADLRFADGSTASAATSVHCPRRKR